MASSEVTEVSGSRTQRRQERNRAALVAAARSHFARAGFDGTTIADIAEAADLGFGTFYRYFADKEAVLVAVLEEGRQDVDEALRADDPALPPNQALALLSERFVRAIGRNRDLLLLGWQVYVRRNPDLRERLQKNEGTPLPVQLAETFRHIIERGVTDGAFAPVDASLAAGLLTGAHMHLLFAQTPEPAVDDVISALRDFELRALGARPLATQSSSSHVTQE